MTTISYAEVQKHKTKDSCWVILYGEVWDVTDFLEEHPGGSSIILKLAGQDATTEYDPVHPPGTLEENLPGSKRLGQIDPTTLPEPVKPAKEIGPEADQDIEIPIENLLNLDEIEEAATKKLSKKGWAYYYSAADDLHSKHLNNTAYRQILLRPRVFVDCSRCDLSTTFLGRKLDLPIYVSPAAMARLAHPDGEWGIAQACKKYGAMQIISNNASMTPEQIVKDAGPDQTFGWQLYVQTERKKSEAMLARINKLDAIKFICLTLDAPVPGKREHDERSKNIVEDTDAAIKDAGGSKLKGGGGIGQSLFFGTDPTLTWKETLPWLKKHTSKPIILKGLQAHEDAFIAAQHSDQVKAIILSNHGGRAADTAPPAVHTLLEIRKYCPEVFNNIEVIVDGGIKRGTDVVKALALGAKAVGVGRAALFGLGAGGIEGVERVLEILKAETATAMRLLGVEFVKDLGPRHINTRALERDIYDGPAGLEGFGNVGLWLSRSYNPDLVS
ncbi:Cytochrome b2, mitochondrial [Cyphellophora attinorum]|uniref:L-lactate dehydrogenase (cytochrome) n=1 Tax=Cyphellophora attinorum TaxID=1664694 RepID=A0A0N1H4M9_9EURO|nr:Cytochrome b2, mitochondrial [Phialophora attinorum]KPI35733.1 Cytochrome b2, mitochondrial [Phialophora attinorum]